MLSLECREHTTAYNKTEDYQVQSHPFQTVVVVANLTITILIENRIGTRVAVVPSLR